MASPNWVRMRGVPSQHRRSHGSRDRSQVWVCTDFPLSTSTGYDDTYQNVEASCPPQFGLSHPDPDFPRCGEQLPGVRPDQRNLCKVVVTYRRMSVGWPVQARTIFDAQRPIGADPRVPEDRGQHSAGPAFGYQLIMSDVRSGRPCRKWRSGERPTS